MGGKYPCYQCDKQYTRKSDLKRHFESVIKELHNRCWGPDDHTLCDFSNMFLFAKFITLIAQFQG